MPYKPTSEKISFDRYRAPDSGEIEYLVSRQRFDILGIAAAISNVVHVCRKCAYYLRCSPQFTETSPIKDTGERDPQYEVVITSTISGSERPLGTNHCEQPLEEEI